GEEREERGQGVGRRRRGDEQEERRPGEGQEHPRARALAMEPESTGERGEHAERREPLHPGDDAGDVDRLREEARRGRERMSGERPHDAAVVLVEAAEESERGDIAPVLVGPLHHLRPEYPGEAVVEGVESISWRAELDRRLKEET